jgi:hypothetical protein
LEFAELFFLASHGIGNGFQRRAQVSDLGGEAG